MSLSCTQHNSDVNTSPLSAWRWSNLYPTPEYHRLWQRPLSHNSPPTSTPSTAPYQLIGGSHSPYSGYWTYSPAYASSLSLICWALWLCSIRLALHPHTPQSLHLLPCLLWGPWLALQLQCTTYPTLPGYTACWLRLFIALLWWGVLVYGRTSIPKCCFFVIGLCCYGLLSSLLCLCFLIVSSRLARWGELE